MIFDKIAKKKKSLTEMTLMEKLKDVTKWKKSISNQRENKNKTANAWGLDGWTKEI